MKRILFVCMGNICRSPSAEAIFNHLLEKKGLAHKYSCELAGISGYHEGRSADTRMMKHGMRCGYKFDTLSRQVRPEDFETFDYVIAMDESNLIDLKDLGGSGKNASKFYRMVDFCQTQKCREVFDPSPRRRTNLTPRCRTNLTPRRRNSIQT
jgi:protein-tyrosine phosphatase